jgi:hypothetical protein
MATDGIMNAKRVANGPGSVGACASTVWRAETERALAYPVRRTRPTGQQLPVMGRRPGQPGGQEARPGGEFQTVAQRRRRAAARKRVLRSPTP